MSTRMCRGDRRPVELRSGGGSLDEDGRTRSPYWKRENIDAGITYEYKLLGAVLIALSTCDADEICMAVVHGKNKHGSVSAPQKPD